MATKRTRTTETKPPKPWPGRVTFPNQGGAGPEYSALVVGQEERNTIRVQVRNRSDETGETGRDVVLTRAQVELLLALCDGPPKLPAPPKPVPPPIATYESSR